MTIADRSKLFSIIAAFRLKIERCWSEESAYKMPEIVTYGAYVSAGQCAVTCLVLMDQLHQEFPGLSVALVSGQLQSTEGKIMILDHGWLQVGLGTDRVIIDPTVDQAASIQDAFTIGSEAEMIKKGLSYIPREIENDHGEVKHPNRFKRYQILKKAWEHLSY